MKLKFILIIFSIFNIQSKIGKLTPTQALKEQSLSLKNAYSKHQKLISSKIPTISQAKELMAPLPKPKNRLNEQLLSKFSNTLQSEHARLAVKQVDNLIKNNNLKNHTEIKSNQNKLALQVNKTIKTFKKPS